MQIATILKQALLELYSWAMWLQKTHNQGLQSLKEEFFTMPDLPMSQYKTSTCSYMDHYLMVEVRSKFNQILVDRQMTTSYKQSLSKIICSHWLQTRIANGLLKHILKLRAAIQDKSMQIFWIIRSPTLSKMCIQYFTDSSQAARQFICQITQYRMFRLSKVL